MKWLLFALLLGLSLFLSTGDASAADKIISNGALVASGPANDALVYTDSGGLWLRRYPLPRIHIPTNNWYGLQSASLDTNTFFTFSGSGPVMGNTYDLSTGTAVLTQSQVMGDTYSRAGAMVKLASGGIVVMWHQNVTDANQDMLLWFAYRFPSGTWQAPISVLVDGTGGPPFNTKAIAQHPADGSIWAFNKKDSTQYIGATRFTEGPSGLTLTWHTDTFITHQAHDINGPSGELPAMVANPDPTRGVIALAYQNEQCVLFSLSPNFVKGCYISVAKITSAAAISFIPYNAYVERTREFAFSVDAGGVYALGYKKINTTEMSWQDLYFNNYNGTSWGTEVHVGRLIERDTPLAFRTKLVGITAKMTDGALHMYYESSTTSAAAVVFFDDESGGTPTPTPTPSCGWGQHKKGRC